MRSRTPTCPRSHLTSRCRPTASATAATSVLGQYFGFAQFEFAGALGLADGRYLAREGGEAERQRVLAIETLGAPPPPGRRRRRPRDAESGADSRALPLTRATAIRAYEPFEGGEEAAAWLDRAVASEDGIDGLVAEGIALLNDALHAQAAAAADPYLAETTAERAVLVRVGYGSGEEVAAGRFSLAREVDIRGGRRRQRDEELRPQERMAAVLGGRERIDACESLLLRARADLNADRVREAALQLRVGLEALLMELAGALVDPGHDEDMATLESRRHEVGEAANAALRGELDAERADQVRELIELSERVIRRRRILRG
ncbi:MAG TPA: hypothetical protein VFY04_10895 [Solirubrobacterales bacterium]|nr:hypothetical protein [Solirubrobacterales bacterium]